MSPDFFDINLGNLIVPFVSAVIGGLLTSQFAFHRYKKEWWWQRKADAYSQLVSALYEAKQFSESHFSALEKGRDLPEDRDKELRAKSKEAREAIDRARDIGMFFLSEEAVKRLKSYGLDQSKASDTESWFDHLDMDLASTSSCLKDIMEIGRKDLGKKR